MVNRRDDEEISKETREGKREEEKRGKGRTGLYNRKGGLQVANIVRVGRDHGWIVAA